MYFSYVSLAVIITIDGPAGSGKSTTARSVARRLGYVYLDTGAMYRAIALAFLRRDADPEDAPSLLSDVRVDVEYDADLEQDAGSERKGETGPAEEMKIFLDGEDVSASIRRPAIGQMASQISALPAVRNKLLDLQRRIGREQEERTGGIVVDGRDTGTVVFPDADVKIFMVADSEERARRRLAQYREQGDDVSFAEVHDEIRSRDEKDRSREIAPLMRAEDAVDLDTTDRSIADQVDFVIHQIDRVRANG